MEKMNKQEISYRLMEIYKKFIAKAKVRNLLQCISALLFIKSNEYSGENASEIFEDIYQNRNKTYVGQIIDGAIYKLKKENKNDMLYLFSDVDFSKISDLEQETLSSLIEELYRLFKLCENKDMLAEAYKNILVNQKSNEVYTPDDIVDVMVKCIISRDNRI